MKLGLWNSLIEMLLSGLIPGHSHCQYCKRSNNGSGNDLGTRLAIREDNMLPAYSAASDPAIDNYLEYGMHL